ncbi:MAG: hypothetical protein U0871_11955 [Gemmataceae bacterium]
MSLEKSPEEKRRRNAVWATKSHHKVHELEEQVGWLRQLLAAPETKVTDHKRVFDRICWVQQSLIDLCGFLKHGDRPRPRGR